MYTGHGGLLLVVGWLLSLHYEIAYHVQRFSYMVHFGFEFTPRLSEIDVSDTSRCAAETSQT